MALLTLATASGCNFGLLQLRNDHRLSFVSPLARERVTAPFILRWKIKDFRLSGLDGSTQRDRGLFAIFLDRAPMPVGKDLKSLTQGDDGCRRDPRCPDVQYLADRGIFVTADSTLKIAHLPQQGQGVGDEQHYINIVLLDGVGDRIGESAWYLPFTSKRRPTQ